MSSDRGDDDDDCGARGDDHHRREEAERRRDDDDDEEEEEEEATMASTFVHRVGIPEKATFVKGIEGVMKEALLCNGPVRSWKKVSGCMGRFSLGLNILFPVMEWGRGYNFATFRHDLISGLTIGSLSIPQVFLSFLSFFCQFKHL